MPKKLSPPALLVRLIMLVLATGCKTPPQDAATPKIVGGEVVGALDPVRKSTIFLVISTEDGGNENETYCSGTLIDTRTVLTAAHCIARSRVSSVLVVLGSADTGSRTIKASSWLKHPDYAKGGLFPATGMNDLALVKIAAPVPAGFFPASLLNEKDPVAEGESLLLAGFGMSKEDQGEIDGLLRKVKTKISLLSPGRKELEYTGGWWGNGACHGDSGGPAFVTRDGKLFLLGVTSRPVKGAGPCDGRGIHTDVRYYLDWIAASQM